MIVIFTATLPRERRSIFQDAALSNARRPRPIDRLLAGVSLGLF
jgi:hypothetical protein